MRTRTKEIAMTQETMKEPMRMSLQHCTLKAALAASFWIAALPALPAFAGGQDVGNGGNVVFCPATESRQQSVEVLDYHEGRVLRGFTPRFETSTEDPTEKAIRILERLKQMLPHEVESVQMMARSFTKEALFLANEELVDVGDSYHASVPEGCKVYQTVIQRTPKFPEDKRYIVNQELWSQMNADQKAGMILHEVIYRRAIEGGAKDSQNVRYINALWSSAELAQLRHAQVLARLELAGFMTNGENILTKESIPVQLKSIRYYADGTIRSALSAESGCDDWDGADFCHRLDRKDGSTVLIGQNILLQFNRDGALDLERTLHFGPKRGVFAIPDNSSPNETVTNLCGYTRHLTQERNPRFFFRCGRPLRFSRSLNGERLQLSSLTFLHNGRWVDLGIADDELRAVRPSRFASLLLSRSFQTRLANGDSRLVYSIMLPFMLPHSLAETRFQTIDITPEIADAWQAVVMKLSKL